METNMECTLYLASSTIPNAGLGLFTTTSYKEKDILKAPQDILIPVGGCGEKCLGMLVDYYWDTTHVSHDHHLRLRREGPLTGDFITGFGSCANSDVSLENIEHQSRNPEVDSYLRPHIGSDAYTPFHHVEAYAYRNIKAGDELFLDYGENYFTARSGIYDSIPLRSDYEEAKRLMSNFFSKIDLLNYNKVSMEVAQDVWSLIRDFATERTQNALPTDVRAVLTSQGNASTLPSAQRSLDWIRQNGLCIDRLAIKPSMILEAGRGAFAKEEISEGSVIVPVPVLQLNRTMQFSMPRAGKRQERQQNLLVNYCYGHPKSTIMLCPYVTTVLLINHSATPNAELRLAKNNQYFKHEVVQKPAKDIISTPLGLIFEVVANRDIQPGQEIFINYGYSWQQAWEKYHMKWNSLIQPLEDGIQTYLDCVSEYNLDSYEEKSPIPSCLKSNQASWLSLNPALNTTTACFYLNNKLSGDHPNYDQVVSWKYSNENGTLGGLCPCILLSRENTRTADKSCQSQYDHSEVQNGSCKAHKSKSELYTALITTDTIFDYMGANSSPNKFELVKHVPLSHIRSVSSEWFDLPPVDNRKPTNKIPITGPFRHHMELPDGVFPSAWLDLV